MRYFKLGMRHMMRHCIHMPCQEYVYNIAELLNRPNKALPPPRLRFFCFSFFWGGGGRGGGGANELDS